MYNFIHINILIQISKKVKEDKKIFLSIFKKIDFSRKKEYNGFMENIQVVIIGGGASGLFLANALSSGCKTVVFERGERVGRKLSATGNGQGNITNLAAETTEYFCADERLKSKITEIIRAANQEQLTAEFRALGVLLQADERGRVYPAGKQASALTDALRFSLVQRGVEVRLQTHVIKLERANGGFLLTAEVGEEKKVERCFAQSVVLCAGGKAAKNFGTDGSAYALAENFGHTVTPLYPSLVQLKTEMTHTKTLKGIRVSDGGLTAIVRSEKIALRGDIIFTDYGVSGDAVFRISAFVADKLAAGVTLSVDFLPDVLEEEVLSVMKRKRAAFPTLGEGELLFGILNNQVGRAVMKRANGDMKVAAKLVKDFRLPVTGSLGFDYAQVTKGGIPLSETDGDLQSRFVPGLYFAGEILDVDGPCGGFNLQWAYASAMRVANALNLK